MAWWSSSHWDKDLVALKGTDLSTNLALTTKTRRFPLVSSMVVPVSRELQNLGQRIRDLIAGKDRFLQASVCLLRCVCVCVCVCPPKALSTGIAENTQIPHPSWWTAWPRFATQSRAIRPQPRSRSRPRTALRCSEASGHDRKTVWRSAATLVERVQRAYPEGDRGKQPENTRRLPENTWNAHWKYSGVAPANQTKERAKTKSSWISPIFVNSGVFPWENKHDSHWIFVPECPCETFMNWPLFGLVCRGHSWNTLKTPWEITFSVFCLFPLVVCPLDPSKNTGETCTLCSDPPSHLHHRGFGCLYHLTSRPSWIWFLPSRQRGKA